MATRQAKRMRAWMILLLCVGWSGMAAAQDGLKLPYSEGMNVDEPLFDITNYDDNALPYDPNQRPFPWRRTLPVGPGWDVNLPVLERLAAASSDEVNLIQPGQIEKEKCAVVGRYGFYMYSPLNGGMETLNVGVLGGADYGVAGVSQGKDTFGVVAQSIEGTGLYAKGAPNGFAGIFEGDVVLRALSNDPGDIIFQTSTGRQKARIFSEPAGTGGLHLTGSDNTSDLTIHANGNVGIGTTAPDVRLVIQGNPGGTAIGRINQIGERKYMGWRLDRESAEKWFIGMDTGDDDLTFRRLSSTNDMVISSSSGNVGIGTDSPSVKLDVAGTTATDVLVIRGGMDLAEPFAVSGSGSIPKGAVVVIDDENPGQLKLSAGPYDPRVAGVVSGAGGINPGLTLTQRGVDANGLNVALTGRVYALADASNGPIVPGDLLTTSEMPGHAMKATDRTRSFGAIIGKAMSPLEKGQGLVLVLVSLQ
jgi:hypothetical protein